MEARDLLAYRTQHIFSSIVQNCGELQRATKQISHHAEKALNIICC